MLHILLGVLSLMAAIAILGAVVGVAGRIVLWQGEHGAATAIVIVAMLIGVFLAMLALLGLSAAGDYSPRRTGRGCS